jgi:mannose/fructose-specific phosphotransferase system component IIA
MPYIGNDIQYGELNSQTFTGDGSTTAFTLTYTVSNVNSLLVTVADVIQEPTTAYTVSGTTLTFTSAPANTDTIHVRYLGRTLDVGTTAIVQDSDQDTLIQVEESADEDTIRFDTGGTERVTINSTSLTSTIPLYIPDGSALTPSVTNTGDTNTGIFFPAADTVGVAVGGTEVWRYGSNPTTAKNLIQNGAMTISQRGVNATILSGFDSTTNSYIADRFLASGGGTPENRADLKHVNSGGPAGFPNFIRYDITTAEAAVAAGESSIIQQRIEGLNLQSIQASSGIVALTLQFYMRSPKTGTHCVYLSTQNTRNIVKEFTVASADTWEKHTVSFIADTSGGTVSNAAVEFLRVGWPIIAGTTYQGTADAWTASNIFATSNQQNLADNTANNIDITGVQLEVGSVATDFEHEDIGETLRKCFRYLFRITGNTGNGVVSNGHNNSTTEFRSVVEFPVEMRTGAGTGTFSSAGGFSVNHSGGRTAGTNATVAASQKIRGYLAITVASGLTAGQGSYGEIDTTSDWIQWSDEL